MRRRLGRHSVLGRAAVIAAIALTLALSLCGFDRDGDGADDQGLDLCAMAIATATGIILLSAPAVTAWSVIELPRPTSDAAPYLPDPPPKLSIAI